MKLAAVVLMYLVALAFLGADTARLDVASALSKKQDERALGRDRRELRVSSSHPAGPAQTLVRPLDGKGASGGPQASSPDAARIRAKRYRQSMNNFQSPRSLGCRFGTCTVQKLAHQLYRLTDKDKVGEAPRDKISPQGYGRRRRRSAPQTGPGRPLRAPTSRARRGLLALVGA
ncbi:pro-adrenomedullin-like [Erinaceus europaeus]|uniref:Pro-adrenomedullin n=1 Tax=Erinaceus europaeus TaxID=9365 RepID=A0ABM3W9B5_ERIEU|nr:pro-adrenomedullin-like [Erinaceus europaeus]